MQPFDSDLSKLGRPVRILVADDDAQNRELIEEVCRAEGFEPFGVSAGGEVLDAVRREAFDLLLIDAAMPGVSGWDVCRMLQADPLTRNIPVIIVTAGSEDAERDARAELGVFDVVPKPFRVFELVQRMRRALRPRSRTGDPPTAPRVRLRRRQVDVLTTLPSPRMLRARLTREIDVCVKAGRPVICAVLRLENETALSAQVGRAVTDALLGGVVAALVGTFPDRVVRGDLDELVVVLSEDQLAKLDAIAADAPAFAVGLGIRSTIEVKIRWGARMLDAHRADADTLINGARQALDVAHQTGAPSHVDRS
jgi:PleD family two-component response regulator